MILGLIAFSTDAQNFEIPKGYKLKTQKDYADLEKDIVKAVDWLINKPLNQEKSKRKEVNSFVMEWLTGSPGVTIEISTDIVTFMNCSECLMIYMGAYAKNAIIYKEDATVLSNNIAAIEAVIEFYNRNKEIIGKNRAIKKYIKLKDKGKLEEHLKSIL